jgi:hypothetical protein
MEEYLVRLLGDIETGKQDLPKLFNTVLQIHCAPNLARTQTEALFENFRVSIRGSIRRAPSSITWASALLKMNTSGEDATNLITQWNAASSKSSWLTGAKASAVKQLLHLPKDVLHTLQSHASMLGWDQCALSDEALSCKKLFPPFTFRVLQSKEWTNRGKVSVTSCTLMFRAMFSKFEGCPQRFRTKPAKAQWEEAKGLLGRWAFGT